MALYIVTLKEDQPLDWRKLSGLGRFEKGESREVELEGPKHIASLREKGFSVKPCQPAEQPPTKKKAAGSRRKENADADL
jgi:hypothetical protein